MKRFLNWKLPAIIVLALLLLVADLPPEYKPDFLPDTIKEMKVNLGLDLQGGSQLDYKVDLRKVPQADQDSIVEGVLSVISRRVDALGVSEPNIYTSEIANETHIIVELAGIKDLEEAKNTVGKTIQLEFKEENDQITDDAKEEVQARAQTFLDNAKAEGSDFMSLGDAEEKADRKSVV